jgi:hypothetical protein
VRLGWAIVLGVVAGALVVWWLGRSERAGTGADAPPPGDAGAGVRDPKSALYRWRDDAGVLQLTDTPPRDRPYDIVDVDALQRRNTFDPRSEAPAGE